MSNLTKKQRDTMLRIRVVLDQETKELLANCPGCNPTKYVNVHRLVVVHKQERKVIDALIAKGFLECQETDGHGNEVRPIFEEYTP